MRTPYLDRREVYDVACCTQCGHGIAEGRKDGAWLSEIYSTGFHNTSQQSSEDKDAPVNMNARARIDWIRATYSSGRLLDIGAGTGAFVRAASNVFEAEGIELAEDTARKAREEGLNIHTGDFMSADLPTEGYAVITMWDVLASLKEIVAAVERCHDLLQPGGRLIITVPMIDSLSARALRRLWPLLIPPVNLHYFTRSSLRRLADSSGFELENITFPGKKVSLQFVAQKAARSVGLHGVVQHVEKFTPAWPVTVNTGDIAQVVMRKSNAALS